MEQNQNLTFEQLNEHFEKADLSEFQSGPEAQFSTQGALSPAELLPKVCKIYNIVKPFLLLAGSFPFIPVKWKEAIKAFTGVMNSICP